MVRVSNGVHLVHILTSVSPVQNITLCVISSIIFTNVFRSLYVSKEMYFVDNREHYLGVQNHFMDVD